MVFKLNPIKFGTDGWRGVMAADFTFERVAKLAPLSAQVLAENYGKNTNSRLIIVGFDRRFMAEDFAQVVAESVINAGFDVLLANSYAPTPAFSWAAVEHNALGALVLTASHNPAKYLGFKVKGAFGGSVSPEITQQIEAKLPTFTVSSTNKGTLNLFDPWPGYVKGLRSKVNIKAIASAIKAGDLTVYADVMHGAAATGLQRLLDCDIQEIRGDRDPLFDGGAPEPIARYLGATIEKIKAKPAEKLGVCLVFDGDSDRIAAIDNQGNYLSSQILIPILIEHLAHRRGYQGEIVKTISGSDLIPRIAQLYGLEIFETPIGYKYIADRMLSHQVLLGGEESGGIGYGHHIPERDALLCALYLLETMVDTKKDLSEIYAELQGKTGFTSFYDRIDLELANMSVRDKLVERLQKAAPQTISHKAVINVLTIDGYKFRLEDGSWLIIRFSGTEPVLRLYAEASTEEKVQKILQWAKNWALTVDN